MRVCGSEAGVGQDLFNDLWLLDEGADSQRPATPGANQGVSPIDLFDEVRSPSMAGVSYATAG
jgi:hypothetical protein